MIQEKAPPPVFRRQLSRLLAAAVALALWCLGGLAVAAPAQAAAAKTKVTVTIDLGKSGSECPALYFKKGAKTALAQVVKTWYIDGQKVAEPWDRFYAKGWDSPSTPSPWS